MKDLKLYTLSVAKDKDSLVQPLSSSHSIDKLKSSVVIDSAWYFTSNGDCKCTSASGQYPMYFIFEVNFII